MSDDNGIVITCGDTRAEFATVCRFKVFLGCNQNLSIGIKGQYVRTPLSRQMVWYDEQRFLADTQPFGFHGRCNTGKGFAAAYTMRQQGVVAINDMGGTIFLMWAQVYGWIHARKLQEAAIILTRANTVKSLIVDRDQRFPAHGITENPALECLFDAILFLLCQNGLFLIDHTAFFAIYVDDRVIDFGTALIQRIFQ